MRVRKLFMAALSAATVLGLFAVPASAGGAGATVFVAHGIPGVKVDVCVNGAEARSNFKYGRAFQLGSGIPAGTYKVKVRLASPGECKGAVAISERIELTDGLNATATAIVRGGEPQLDIRVNDTGIAGGTNASVTVRHLAKAPTVDVWVNGGAGPAVPGLERFEEAGPVELPGDQVYAYWVAAEGDSAPVIGPDVAELAQDTAYQIMAVGTNASNWRFIVIGQPGS
jgi:hypothetical protein